jgi:hypothetical protein
MRHRRVHVARSQLGFLHLLSAGLCRLALRRGEASGGKHCKQAGCAQKTRISGHSASPAKKSIHTSIGVRRRQEKGEAWLIHSIAVPRCPPGR